MASAPDPLVVQGCQQDPQKQQTQPKTWIEILLVGEDDKPVPDLAYRVWLPDGTTRDGHLNDNGFARIDNIDPGACVVTFPTLDTDAWEGA
jgi:hypothetical protein